MNDADNKITFQEIQKSTDKRDVTTKILTSDSETNTNRLHKYSL